MVILDALATGESWIVNRESLVLAIPAARCPLPFARCPRSRTALPTTGLSPMAMSLASPQMWQFPPPCSSTVTSRSQRQPETLTEMCCPGPSPAMGSLVNGLTSGLGEPAWSCCQRR